ncbi:MAG: uroporphyrinogen decarboxylase family protein [Candidatus Humimicrobiaceae bacterium]
MDMIEKLERLLDYIEENIDIGHVEEVEKLHIDAINYKSVPYLPLSLLCPLDDKYPLFLYIDAYNNPEKMLYNELLWSFLSNLNNVRIKDYFPMQIRSNHGVGIIASLFGVSCKVINDNMPWVDHFNNDEEILNIIENGIPKFDSALLHKVLLAHQCYIEILRKYPKCFKAIHITQPDLQGPFDIAHLLVGEKIFYVVYDNPKLIHRLLGLITETYIGVRNFIEPYLTDKAGADAVYVHGSIYRGRVVIKDDTAAITLSREMYNEFSKYYNEKIFKAFQAGSLHHCGQERSWHFSSFDCENLAGMNYGNPEMHELKKTYDFWKERKVPIIWWGYNQDYSFLNEVYNLNIKTGMSLAAKVNNLKEAKEILKKHTER